MRHSVLGPNAPEKMGLIPLLSFQWQIPAGAYEKGLSSRPNITQLSPLSPPLPLSLLSVHMYSACIDINTVSRFLHTSAQHLLHAVPWQEKVIITTHKLPSTPA